MPSLAQQIADAQSHAAKRRAAAMCPLRDSVLGFWLKRMTPLTFSLLHASGNRYLHGGIPTEADLRDYVWFHAYEGGWTPGATDAQKARVLARFEQHLCPVWKIWGHRTHRAVSLGRALAEVAELVRETFTDSPPAGEADTAPAGATLAAQLVDIMARRYGWEMERTLNTPLPTIYGLMRAMSVSNGELPAPDETEAHLLATYLRDRNAAPQPSPTSSDHG